MAAVAGASTAELDKDDPAGVDPERRARAAAAVDRDDGDHSAADETRLPHRAQPTGYESDKSQIRDLLATLGVGLTGQYLEQIGRKLVGGLFGKVAGGLAGSLARGATGAMFSFATTYAIGQVARRYYAGGRVMSAELIERTFKDMLTQGKALQAEYLPQIQQQARTLDAARIVQMVRGQLDADARTVCSRLDVSCPGAISNAASGGVARCYGATRCGAPDAAGRMWPSSASAASARGPLRRSPARPSGASR